jgi:hypothetical protein
MKHAVPTLAALGLAVALAVACQDGFPHVGAGKRLTVAITNGDVGAPDRRLPLSTTTPRSFTVHIEAQQPDGSLDTSFGGFVRLSVKPGTVSDLDARNVQLHAGVADGVVVPIVGSYGDTHLWAEDVGYEPADPARQPPPECSDGIDNNHNGLIDYPADPGCYSPIDDTEDVGTYATGISDTLYFERPRISFVRGYDPASNGNGNTTAFPHQQVDIDTGWRGGTSYAFSTVVIRVSGEGFYAQDIQDDQHPGPGYGGIYAYNYVSPPFMRVCDRLQLFGGTTSDFYGFTEVNYPTWQLEYWDPSQRPCMVPEPTVLGVADLTNDNRLWQVEATLVRVLTAGTVSVHVASHFGPDPVPVEKDASGNVVKDMNGNPVYAPGPTASNCDFNHDGKIDYSDTQGEAACAAACNGTSSQPPTDFECSEFSQYLSQSEFQLIVTDASSGTKGRIQAKASDATQFNPLVSRGDVIKSFTGTLSYFSGGTQFTIEARCNDDVIADPGGQPLTSDVACVHPRTALDNQQFAQ